MSIPLFRIAEIQLYERPVTLRMPFKFGITELRACPEAYARVRIEALDGTHAWGAAAEMMVPKWFDKNPKRTDEQNIADLRASLAVAQENYSADKSTLSAYAHFAAHYESQLAAGALLGLRPLVANYGPALLDRAIADAVCRLTQSSFFSAVKTNLLGIAPAGLARALAGFDHNAFLASLTPRFMMAARHTIGMSDVIAGHPNAVRDGLPESLEEVIAQYGPSHFKIKLCGDTDKDMARLTEIARVLDQHGPYQVTLDGNEQYDDLQGLAEVMDALQVRSELQRLGTNLLYIEQPIHRASAYETYVTGAQFNTPIIIDESDSDLDAFPRAKRLGYKGVSAKSCKGIYKSLINAMRCAQWNGEAATEGRAERYFMAGEDLTMQTGLAVQQDLAIGALLGLTHTERNGHHFVNGMAALPETEQQAFLSAHSDLYTHSHGAVRLNIRAGQLAFESINCVGFASAAQPDWMTLPAMKLN
jgi:hypothetical protein